MTAVTKLPETFTLISGDLDKNKEKRFVLEPKDFKKIKYVMSMLEVDPNLTEYKIEHYYTHAHAQNMSLESLLQHCQNFFLSNSKTLDQDQFSETFNKDQNKRFFLSDVNFRRYYKNLSQEQKDNYDEVSDLQNILSDLFSNILDSTELDNLLDLVKLNFYDVNLSDSSVLGKLIEMLKMYEQKDVQKKLKYREKIIKTEGETEVYEEVEYYKGYKEYEYEKEKDGKTYKLDKDGNKIPVLDQDGDHKWEAAPDKSKLFTGGKRYKYERLEKETDVVETQGDEMTELLEFNSDRTKVEKLPEKYVDFFESMSIEFLKKLIMLADYLDINVSYSKTVPNPDYDPEEFDDYLNPLYNDDLEDDEQDEKDWLVITNVEFDDRPLIQEKSECNPLVELISLEFANRLDNKTWMEMGYIMGTLSKEEVNEISIKDIEKAVEDYKFVKVNPDKTLSENIDK